MDCAICHRMLTLWGPDHEARVALLEDGAAFCHRCAFDVARDGVDAVGEDDAATELQPLAMAA